MKHLITIFSLLLLLTNASFAVQKTITPEVLTRKDSKDYKEINALINQLFTNIETSIDTSKYPAEYNNFPLMEKTETQSPSFYYVKLNNAELLFDKESKQLEKITFQKSFIPKSWFVYTYPMGNLQHIEIWKTNTDIYLFTPTGKVMNFKKYVKNIDKQIKSHWQFDSQTKYNMTPIKCVLTINKNGELKKCKVLQASGIKEVDNSVANAILNAVPFKPFPEFWTLDKIQILMTFAINYKY